MSDRHQHWSDDRLLCSKDFYPMTILDARYSGTYEGGQYILTAGSRNPRDETDICASDVPCAAFWRDVADHGPFLENGATTPGGDARTLYVDSGDHPATLFDEYTRQMNALDDAHNYAVIETVFQSYQGLLTSALDGNAGAQYCLIGLAMDQSPLDPSQGPAVVLESMFDAPPVDELDDRTLDDVCAFLDGALDTFSHRYVFMARSRDHSETDAGTDSAPLAEKPYAELQSLYAEQTGESAVGVSKSDILDALNADA